MQRNLSYLLVGALAVLGPSACASAPTTQMTRAESALRAAQEVGAPEYPKAAYHLQLAQERIELAKPLMDGRRKDKERAEKLLARAELDAELALDLARTEQAKDAATQAWAEVHDLQQGRR